MAGLAPKYYYLTLGLLGVCVIIGLYVAYRFQREVNDDLGPTTEKDLLDPLEKAFYSGLMDEAEFRRIQASMAKTHPGKATKLKIRQTPGPTPAPELTSEPPPEVEGGPV